MIDIVIIFFVFAILATVWAVDETEKQKAKERDIERKIKRMELANEEMIRSIINKHMVKK